MSAESRWQYRVAPEKRWEWLPQETCECLSATGDVVTHPLLGRVDKVSKSFSTGNLFGEIREVPRWWGSDANLAAGVLAACRDEDDETQILLGIEDRPWWPTQQAGPFWGFVEPSDMDLPSAMAREAVEESMSILGTEQELKSCLSSELSNAPVCSSPWHPDDFVVLRMVSLGTLDSTQRGALVGSFRRRRLSALALGAALASHLEVEELQWSKASPLLDSIEEGRRPLIGKAQRPLRGFVAELLQEVRGRTGMTDLVGQGLRSRHGRRFRDFCRGNAEVRGLGNTWLSLGHVGRRRLLGKGETGRGVEAHASLQQVTPEVRHAIQRLAVCRLVGEASNLAFCAERRGRGRQPCKRRF